MSAGPGLPLGRIAGAPVRLSWTWALIAAFLMLSFGPSLQRAVPSLGGGAYLVALAYAVLLALSVLVHEVAHALVGRAGGQQVEEIALTLWGGHTQFRAPHERPLPTLLTALAGPAANLALAGVVWAAAQAVPAGSLTGLLLDVAVWANLLLAAFNALPGLPLDGGRLVECGVWAATGDRDRGTQAAGWTGRAIALGLVAWALVLPLVRGERPDLLFGTMSAWVAWTLWQGASAAVARGRWGRRLASVTVDAHAVPALGLPADTPLGHAAAAAHDGGTARAVVALDASGAPLGLLDPALVQGSRPSPDTPLSAVCTAVAPGAVLRRSALPAGGAALVERLADADAPAWILTDDAGTVTAVLPRASVLDAVHRTAPTR